LETQPQPYSQTFPRLNNHLELVTKFSSLFSNRTLISCNCNFYSIKLTQFSSFNKEFTISITQFHNYKFRLLHPIPQLQIQDCYIAWVKNILKLNRDIARTSLSICIGMDSPLFFGMHVASLFL
jgi:hypothetical protein